jgi:hypothetical protein
VQAQRRPLHCAFGFIPWARMLQALAAQKKMNISEDQLLNILKIGHDTSMRGEGISLHEALSRTGYANLRSSFNADDLQKIIKKHPDLPTQWQAYSEDKRTSGGWYITEDNIVGNLNGQQDKFKTRSEAVAEYVVRELDYWVKK